MDAASFKEDIKQHLYYSLAKDEYSTTDWDNYRSVVFSIMDRLHHWWLTTQRSYYKQGVKRAYYLSMEYLIGRLLDNTLINLGLQEVAAEALDELGLDYDKIREAEWDAGLGNGGLGRLAACFLDSMATMGLPGYGYGLRYDYGIFYQRIENGYQVEYPDLWLQYGNPWDLVRPKIKYTIPFYGRSEAYTDSDGNTRYNWVDTEPVVALAYDIPVPGYKNGIANNLRLWKATSAHDIDLKSFNQGEYIDAVRDNMLKENITRVLYPNDKVFVGQELRLKQEYMLVSASLQDIIRRFQKTHNDWRKFPDKVAIQCNDTHPNLAVPDLMRYLLDRVGLDWETSWDITVNSLAYTNHTLMPEALEKWPVSLMRKLLPRHMEIIYEINQRFLDKVKVKLGSEKNRIERMSIIRGGEDPDVHMGALGIVGTSKINGVAELHSSLLKKNLFKDFYEMFPERFTNKTNGITPRRWIRQCNPGLFNLISSKLGNEDWITDLAKINKIEKYIDDPEFQKEFIQVKKENKRKLADYIWEEQKVEVNPDSIFDIMIKRIHEYKRQLMAALHAITLYNRIKKDPEDNDVHPRTILFSGKAAPGYTMAKLHIKLINNIAGIINNDPEVGDQLKVLFLRNYSVTLAERMIPAANLSEQISTAGKEASGTGNMKFALNGALTIGTLDGANIEIKEEVGDDNIFIFGHTVDEVEKMRREGYNPWKYYEDNEELKQAIDQIRDGFFSPEDPDLFQPIIDALLHKGDYFMVMADYEPYIKKQQEVEQLYRDTEAWTTKALKNVARMGHFSSDRTIMEYADEIWDIEPVKNVVKESS